MVFNNSFQKNIIKELGFDPDRDYKADDISADLFLALTTRIQKQGFIYDGTEPIPTDDCLICEEMADALSELE